MACARCKGGKQIETSEGKFQDCECVKLKRARLAYAQAGILEEFWEMTWQSALKGFSPSKHGFMLISGLSRNLTDGEGLPKRFLAVTGGSDYTRMAACSLLTRDLIRSGMGVMATPLVDLVDLAWSEDWEEKTKLLMNASVLWLQLEIERDHKWNGLTLERAFHNRRFKTLTILSARRPMRSWVERYPNLEPFTDRRRSMEVDLERKE